MMFEEKCRNHLPDALKLLTTRDVAKAGAVCERSVANWVRAGLLPCIRIGRSVRFDPADVEAFFLANKKGGGQ